LQSFHKLVQVVMPPSLIAQTIFANKYYLVQQLDGLPSCSIQHWEARDFSAACNVSLWILPTVNLKQATVFSSALASYQQANSSNLPIVHDYGVSLDDTPFFVLEAESYIPFRSVVPITDEDQLAAFIGQLTDVILTLHKQGLSFSSLTTDTISCIQNCYQPLPLVTQKTGLVSGNDVIDLCKQLAVRLEGVDWLIKNTREQALTIEQLHEIAENFLASKVWTLPEKIKVEPPIITQPLPDEIRIDDPVIKQPIPPRFPQKWLIRLAIAGIILILGIVFWDRILPHQPHDPTVLVGPKKGLPPPSPPSPLRPIEEYQVLLQKGQELVEGDRKEEALQAFQKAVIIQQENKLPQDPVVQKLYEDYKNKGDERFKINITPPAMNDMMDIPLKYYQLANALHSTPYLEKQIADCINRLNHAGHTSTKLVNSVD
jgi:hypothetical protein